jgi:hypothetical protein
MDTSEKYLKGFNASYFIAKYKPILIDSLLKSEINTDFMKGFRDGKLTFDKEKNKILTKKKMRLQDLEKISKKKKKRGRGI